MSTHFRNPPLMILLILTSLISGCLAKPETAQPEADIKAYTQAAEIIIAELTKNAPTLTDTPQVLPTETTIATPTLEQLPATSPPPPIVISPPTDTLLPTLTPTLTFTPSPTSSPEPQFVLAFKDDFSYTAGWTVGDEGEARFHYTKGGYAIVNKIVQDAAYSVRSRAYGDVRVEVDGSRLGGPLSGYYGVICHFVNGSNYYLFAVGPDGWFGIGKQKAGNLVFLKEGQGGSVYTGDTVNHIRADCVQGTLTLYVNGVLQLQITDSDFTGGAVGLAAGTKKETGFEALFDNFFVYVPQ